MGRRRRRDDHAVDDVLADLRDLHLRLSSDLSAASGAVETDEPGVAVDILDADRVDLQRFLESAGRRLVPADQSGDASAEDAALGAGSVTPLPTQRKPNRGWRRALPTLPVVAVLAGSAAAAAVIAPQIGQHSGGAQPSTTARPPTVHASTYSAVTVPAGFEQLRHAIVGHASAREVLAAADRWHHQLAALIDTAAHNPRQLRTVISLLRREQELLATHHVPDAGAMLAAATRLERHLLRTAAPLISSLPIPTQSLLPASPSAHPAHHRAATSTSTSSPRTTSSARKPSPASSPSAPAPSPTGSPQWTPPWQPTASNQSVFGNFH